MNRDEGQTTTGGSSRATKLLRVGFRLSLVVATLCGLADAFRRYSEAVEEHQLNFTRRLSYECAARVQDERLLKARNDFGNINVAGAPFHCSTRDHFWVAMYEIEQVRKGAMDFSTARPWFRWQSTAAASTFGFVATNLAALALVGCAIVLRWIVRPISG